MKKKMFSLLAVSAVAGLMSLNKIDNNTFAKAEEHTHNFVNGVCSCNAHLFEAEDGIIEGENTDQSGTEGWVVGIEQGYKSDNPNHPMSGNHDVENWAAAGNTVKIRFALNEKLSDVNVSLWIACGIQNQSTSGLGFEVNGRKVEYKTKVVECGGSGQWWYYREIKLTADFAEGNNEMVLTNKTSLSWNIDCIEVNFPSTTVVSDYDATAPLGELPPKQEEVIEELPEFSSDKFLLMEAEYATECVGTPKNGADNFFEENENSSSGANVANWGTGDNILKFDFNTDKAVTAATIKIYISSDYNDLWSWIVIPRINGGSGGAPEFSKDSTVRGIDIDSCGMNDDFTDWYDFKEVTLPSVSLLSGKNVLELEAFDRATCNIDYVTIETTEDVKFTFKPVNHGVGGKGGPKALEAEKGVIEGTTSDGSDSFIESSTSDNPDHATSGGNNVGKFGVAGNKITLTFKSTQAVENTTLDLWLAPCGNGGSLSDIMSLSLNDNELALSGNLPAGSNNKNYNWTKITVSNVSIKSGSNTLVLTNKTGENFNVDCIVVNVPDSVSITQTIFKDTKAPTISIITVKSNDIKTYSPVEIAYTVTDDVDKTEDIKITLKCYYNFGEASQKSVAIKDNVFTPTQVGKYTVIITAKDKSDNSVSKKRHIIVEKEGEKPVDDNTGDRVKHVEGKKVGGYVTFAGGLGVSAGLIATMIVLNKKRK